MAIFYDYIKGINAHKKGESAIITKIKFNENSRPSIIINEQDYGTVITTGPESTVTDKQSQTIQTDLILTKDLNVSGKITAEKDLEITGDLTVDGNTTFNTLELGNGTTITLKDKENDTDGSTILNTLECSDIASTGAINIGTTKIESDQITTSNLIVSGIYFLNE